MRRLHPGDPEKCRPERSAPGRFREDPPAGDLAPGDLVRYARQIILPEVGETGQLRLRGGSVLLVGVGGLGSPLALYLAAAGVGRIGIVEPEAVELSNLQRQILYDTSQEGRPKHQAARERLRALNPAVQVETYPVRLTASNALAIMGEFDVIADGADNFATRYLVNDTCTALGKPDVQGSVLRFEGQLSVFDARVGPCYRCLFPQPPSAEAVPSCAEAGVLGVLPGVIGALQATEVLKCLLRTGDPLIGRLLIFDALVGEFRMVRFARDPDCPGCGPSRAPSEDDPAAPPLPQGPFDPLSVEVSPGHVRAHLERGRKVVWLDVRDAAEVRICRILDSLWIPLDQLAPRLPEVDPTTDVVVYCHTGLRSLQAARFLRSQGLTRVWSLLGGIDAWSREGDRRIPRY